MAGSIQGDINQALGTLGALAIFSPQLQEHAENMAESRKIKKEEKILNKQVEAATSTGKPLEPQIADDIDKRQKELIKRKFELKPSEETYQEYAKTLPTKIKEDPEMIHQERMEGIPDEARRAAEYDYAYKQAYNNELANLDKQQQAMARMTRQADAKKALRRNFMDYIGKMPMFGETVGSIDARHPGFAKQIASQYDRNARRRIMNQMDREARNGKQ